MLGKNTVSWGAEFQPVLVKSVVVEQVKQMVTTSNVHRGVLITLSTDAARPGACTVRLDDGPLVNAEVPPGSRKFFEPSPGDRVTIVPGICAPGILCEDVFAHGDVFVHGFAPPDESDILLDAFIDDPRDSATRNRYADWLVKQGDIRGEYLRVWPSTGRAGKQDEEHYPEPIMRVRGQIDAKWLAMIDDLDTPCARWQRALNTKSSWMSNYRPAYGSFGDRCLKRINIKELESNCPVCAGKVICAYSDPGGDGFHPTWVHVCLNPRCSYCQEDRGYRQEDSNWSEPFYCFYCNRPSGDPVYMPFGNALAAEEIPKNVSAIECSESDEGRRRASREGLPHGSQRDVCSKCGEKAQEFDWECTEEGTYQSNEISYCECVKCGHKWRVENRIFG